MKHRQSAFESALRAAKPLKMLCVSFQLKWDETQQQARSAKDCPIVCVEAPGTQDPGASFRKGHPARRVRRVAENIEGLD